MYENANGNNLVWVVVQQCRPKKIVQYSGIGFIAVTSGRPTVQQTRKIKFGKTINTQGMSCYGLGGGGRGSSHTTLDSNSIWDQLLQSRPQLNILAYDTS